jgi:acyl-CoA synthetase (AMP-forming)/AMP-acid ligase II
VSGALPLLRDADIRARPEALAEAWDATPTFAVVPDKLAADVAWFDAVAAQLPETMGIGHFALLTSGSTGEPKLVLGRRDRAEALARTLHGVQANEPARAAVVALPLSYSYAFVNQWLWAKVHRRTLVLTDGMANPAALRRALESTPDAMLCLVGAQVPLLMQHFGGAEFPGVVRLHFAGGRFPQEQLDALARLFPRARVFNNYGCAEAMPRLTVRPADAAGTALNIGRPIPGVELRTDADGALQFRSAYRAVALGVGGTLAALDDAEWLPTGDLGRQGGDGSWELVGRAAEVFKRFGEKVSPTQLLGHVSRAWNGGAAFYHTRDTMGEVAHVLVLSPRPDAATVMRVLQELRAHFPRPHWPYRVEARDSLPLLPSGKPDVRRLADEGGDVLWRQRY